MRYRVKSGKIHARINGEMKVYRPGDIITLDPDDVAGFKDLLEQLEPDAPPPQPKAGLKAVHVGGGRWNVVNEVTKKKINDKLLTKEEAAALVEAGTSEADPDLTKEPDRGVIPPVTGG